MMQQNLLAGSLIYFTCILFEAGFYKVIKKRSVQCSLFATSCIYGHQQSINTPFGKKTTNYTIFQVHTNTLAAGIATNRLFGLQVKQPVLQKLA